MSAETLYWKPWPTDQAVLAATVAWTANAHKTTHCQIVEMLNSVHSIVMVREHLAIKDAQNMALRAVRDLLRNSESLSVAIESISQMIEERTII
jgi:hypothetical protein